MTEGFSLSRIQFILLGCLMLVSPLVLAWGSVGHRVIAQIAYDQLTPNAKKNVENLNHGLDKIAPVYSFSQAANWPDWLAGQDVKAFSSWHYIDKAYSIGGVSIQPFDKHNVVWAISDALQVLQSRKSSDFEKAIFLRFLMHFVGDIHQPLHCISLYSAAFPNGDRGGNLYLIKEPKLKNLHQLWDRGLKIFEQFYPSNPRHDKQIQFIARQLENKYPPSNFNSLLAVSDPELWSQESYLLAKDYAYKIEVGSMPSQDYIDKGQIVVGKQLALAGYRLGGLLNQLFS